MRPAGGNGDHQNVVPQLSAKKSLTMSLDEAPKAKPSGCRTEPRFAYLPLTGSLPMTGRDPRMPNLRCCLLRDGASAGLSSLGM